MKPLNVADYRALARKRLPRGVFEYIDRGTEDEVGLRRIRSVLDEITLTQTVLNDVKHCDTGTVVFDTPMRMPVIISPTASAGLAWYDGEVQLARAARASGIPFCVATQSITTIEAIASRAEGAHLWFQLYVFQDRNLSRVLMERARAQGASTLLVTVDGARSPKKEWNIRNGFGIPIKPSVAGALDLARHPRWSIGVLLRHILDGSGVPTYAHYPAEFRTRITRESNTDAVKVARDLTWDDVAWIRKAWSGNLVIKGIQTTADAKLALAAGADGLVVSCHGGRNFDTSVTAIEAVPRIADAVGNRMTVLADSGIRRGSDIVKFLAAGARAVLVGRATLYGIAAAGERGATDVLAILRDELEHCLAFMGRTSIAAVSRSVLWSERDPTPAADGS